MQFLLSLHEKCSKGHRKMNLPASVKKTRVRITSLNLRCSSRAVSLYNAHFSWLWTAVAASIKPNTNEIGTINLILTKQKIIKRAISAQAHARASGRKQPDKSTPNFFTFKCQQPFDSYGSFVLRIVLIVITDWRIFLLRYFWNCFPLEFFDGDLQCPLISGRVVGIGSGNPINKAISIKGINIKKRCFR